MQQSYTNKVLQIAGNQLRIPISGNPSFILSPDFTIGELKAKLECKGVSVRFSLLNGAEISPQSPTDLLLSTVCSLEIGQSIFKLFPPEQGTSGEKFHMYMKEKNFDEKEAQAIHQFVSRLEQQFGIRDEFTKPEIRNIVAKAIPRGKEQYRSEEELKKTLRLYDKELDELKNQHEKIMRKANRYARGVASLGLLGLMGQWVFVATGVYHFWCWDIMEPVAYVMGLGDVAIASGAYVYSNTEFSLPSVYDALVERKKRQLYANIGVQHNRFDFLNQESIKLRDELYALP